jgi:hypothetical protein
LPDCAECLTLQGGKGRADCLAALTTLFHVLLTVAKVMAPFTPFICETMYRNLRAALVAAQQQQQHGGAAAAAAEVPESVHWCDMPAVEQVRRYVRCRSRANDQTMGQVHCATLRHKVDACHSLTWFRDTLHVCHCMLWMFYMAGSAGGCVHPDQQHGGQAQEARPNRQADLVPQRHGHHARNVRAPVQYCF